jgi:hypothetical protein
MNLDSLKKEARDRALDELTHLMPQQETPIRREQVYALICNFIKSYTDHAYQSGVEAERKRCAEIAMQSFPSFGADIAKAIEGDSHD